MVSKSHSVFHIEPPDVRIRLQGSYRQCPGDSKYVNLEGISYQRYADCSYRELVITQQIAIDKNNSKRL